MRHTVFTHINNGVLETVRADEELIRKAEKSLIEPSRYGKWSLKTKEGWIVRILFEDNSTRCNNPATELMHRKGVTDMKVYGDVYLFCYVDGIVCGHPTGIVCGCTTQEWRDPYIRKLLMPCFFGEEEKCEK